MACSARVPWTPRTTHCRMTSRPRLSRSEESRLKAASGTDPVPLLAASRRPDGADEADATGRRTTLPSSPTKLT
eukprot:scaffold87598_cov41-Phaeocystis_antarctica.AAC.2